MALTVRDILNLPALRTFQCVAGEGGMDRDVITAGIADYEFVKDIGYNLSDAFEKDSLVISSLLFAKDDPSLILPAVKVLNETGVAAFVYKSVFFEELPTEVTDYADAENFPIFSYKEGTWFENVIFEVLSAVEKDDTRLFSETNIEKMIKGTAREDEIDIIRKGISLLLNKSVTAAYIKTPGLDASRIFRAYYMSKRLKEKLLVTKYDNGVFLLITTPKWDENTHRIILSEACETLSIDIPGKSAVLSNMHPAGELDKAFKEAYYGWMAGFIMDKKISSFRNAGLYSAILPLAESVELKAFAQNYMGKLKGYSETVKAYINNDGDMSAAAADLKCHVNTVRYRINKMKELTDTDEGTDCEFFRDLSVAYMVEKYLELSQGQISIK